MLQVVEKDSKAKHIGEVYQTNKAGRCTVVAYKNAHVVTVQFEDGTQVQTAMHAVRSGAVRNPNAAGVFGEGIRGTDLVESALDKRIERIWRTMLSRCYDENNKAKGNLPTYKGCIASENFKRFSFFKDWYKSQVGAESNFQIDKDLLAGDQKQYHEDTCLLVPREINAFLTTVKKKDSNDPVGVREIYKGRHRVLMTIGGVTQHKGVFDSAEEAFSVYKQLKEAYARVLADKWKGCVDERVYRCMMTYSINPDGTFDVNPYMQEKSIEGLAA